MKISIELLITKYNKVRRNKRLRKCWNCKHFTPTNQRFGECDKVKTSINYRDYRETDTCTEYKTATENGWRISKITVIGYMVCDLHEWKI